jgi:hypothetical protein
MQKIKGFKTATSSSPATSFCVARVGNVGKKKRFIYSDYSKQFMQK